MKTYLQSIFSIKKITHKNLSFFAYWDSNSYFTKNSEIRRFVKLKASSIGKYSRINPNCKLSNTKVGNFTAIGRGTAIGLGRHPLNYVSTQNIFYKKNNMNNRWVKPIDLPTLKITIGNDVWVGIEALILDGVTVGDGAVVGARSVVTKDVPPYAIVVGVPAKIIKYRFDEEIREKLLSIKWWDMDDEFIEQNIEIFRKADITLETLEKFIKKKINETNNTRS